MKKYGRGFVYIYNPEQKDFYRDDGCTIVDSDINKRTNKQYWVFKYEEASLSFDKWCRRGEKLKNSVND